MAFIKLNLSTNRPGVLQGRIECHTVAAGAHQPRRKQGEEARIGTEIKKALARLQLAPQCFLDCKFVVAEPVAVDVPMMAPPEQARGMAAPDANQGIFGIKIRDA